MTHRNAAVPDSASTMEYPSGSNTDFSASRLAGLSSTIRTGTGHFVAGAGPSAVSSLTSRNEAFMQSTAR
jgi:hypothetical protein